MYSINHDLMAKLGLTPGTLAGQTALITGGARGIGEGLATRWPSSERRS